jgi:formate dehydrogenase major subunit
VPSLGASFGRGAATTAQWDVANSDCVLIMGSNMAECHPIAFRFALEARRRGAKLIHVDPRFTRTSALCDIYAPIRAGTDIAFLGGLIRYILENDLWFREYALAYTNLSTIIRDDFRDASDGDGFFSGWDEGEGRYDEDTWQYAWSDKPANTADMDVNTGESYGDRVGGRRVPPPTDPTLEHPNCVYRILKRHYAAYTPEMVERVTGCPHDVFLKIAETFCAASGREKTASICYAVGWTQHTVGVQNIRAAAIIQSLLGNIGRPGGGILALRGHSTIQGSTDIPTLYNLLPGYLPQPAAKDEHATLDDYLKNERTPTGWWWNYPKYFISLMRAWYGDTVGPENEWGFQWLPRITGDHSQLPMTMAMKDGEIRGMLVPGQNPAVGGQNAHLVRMGLANLQWLVVRDTFETETASFWYASPEIASGELKTADIQTEVFLMPAALPVEKEGTFTNTHRLIQWHDKLVDPPGDCRSEAWFCFHLGRRLKELYAGSNATKDEPVHNLRWDYPTEGPLAEPVVDEILREINGYTWPSRDQIADFADLEDDGTTACGCWIYTGAYPANDRNQARSRVPDSPGGPGTHLNWAFAWPSNRRIMYNRASADLKGRPWSERKRYVWWDEATRRWTGVDRPEFALDKPPDYTPDWSQRPVGMDAHDGCSPFMMIEDGKAGLFTPAGVTDGPLPTHFEPVESPVRNLLYRQQINPAAKLWPRPDNEYHRVGDGRYPYVITTYRLTEHHAGGASTRNVPSLAELQPEGFCEVPEELAAQLTIASGDWVLLETARYRIETRALVTLRLRPLRIDGRTVYQIGLPWHYGWQGYAQGAAANDLTALAGDANTSIHEGKAFTCNLRLARKGTAR